MNKDAKIRELFVEDLADVRGGAPGGVPGKPPTATTMACCEENSLGCCGETEPTPI